MNFPELAEAMIVTLLVLFGAGVGATILRWLWRKSSGSGTIPAADVTELRARLAELELERGHMAELEERLDFAERLLARQAEIDRLAEGR